MKKIATWIAGTCVLAGCAGAPEATTSPAGARAEKDFVTGSNLPRRNRMGGDGVSVMTPEEFERARVSGGQGGQGGLAEPGAAR